MMLMCAQSNSLWHWAAGAYPGKVGMLLSPQHFSKQAIRFWMPYALDNGAFIDFTHGTEWSHAGWLAMMQKARMSVIKPLWALVPDVVQDREGTIRNWFRYYDEAKSFGFPLAFAVQDGMTPEDVPSEADVVFVGGSTEFKMRTLRTWIESFPRVHVGRVNEFSRLTICEEYGAESVDGSGWFRDTQDGRRGKQIVNWLTCKKPSNEVFEFAK